MIASAARSVLEFRSRLTKDALVLLLAIGALLAAAYVQPFRWGSLGTAFGDTDDAMRLVQIRDWLAGQSWFDLLQHRMGTPDSAPMHWSRLVDLPIAMIIWLSAFVVPAADAERVALVIWPLALLVATMTAVYLAAARVAGRMAGLLAVGLMASQRIVAAQFISGRIDHHNVQICLAALLLASAVRSSRSSAAVAGFVTAVLLAVGLEAIMVVAVVATGYATRFVLKPVEASSLLRSYALTGLSTSVALFAALVPASRWGVSACDAMAANYLAAIVIAAIGVTAASFFAPRRLSTRLVAVAVPGLAAIAVFLALEPVCVRGPMAEVPADVQRMWLDHVQEMQSVFGLIAQHKWGYLVGFLPGLLGLAAGAFGLICRRADVTMPTGVLYAVLAVTLACALVHLRLVMYAQMAAAVVLGFETWRLAERRIGGQSPLAIALMLVLLVNALPRLVSFATSGGSASAAQAHAHPDSITSECNRVADYAVLRELPPGKVVSFIDIGPFVLASTAHSVLAAPYHRESANIRAVLEIMTAPPETGRDLARWTGARYVALCSGSPEARYYRQRAARGFATRLIAGDVPDGMSRVAGDGAVLLFRLWPEQPADFESHRVDAVAR